MWSQQLHAVEPSTGRTEIQWETIQGCPTERDVKKLVEERLGQPLDFPREQSLLLQAKVTRNGAGEYEVDLLTTGASGNGRRRISNADCEKLTQAVTLVMALAIDPKRALEFNSAAPNSSDAGSSFAIPYFNTPPGHLPEYSGSALAASTSNSADGKVQLTGLVTFPKNPTEDAAALRWRVGAQALVGAGMLPVIDSGMLATVGFFPSSAATHQVARQPRAV